MNASKRLHWSGFATPVVILASIILIYLPLPGGLLDFFLAANLCASVLILLTAVYVRSPLEFSLFPSLLLITTLSRIALNVATTRLILARGPTEGSLAAGQVVKAFGEFVAGDQLAVGLVIFLILFIVQFLVITAGTTRIGEVAARFALDGLPGRQMAIDADLKAGVISHEQAHLERRRLLDSAEFYGSMDGASKYVRGDAIAGLCITVINLVGGIALGLSQGMSAEHAARTFSMLTIGDGLCSQLPALLISVAAGLLVTRGSSDSGFSEASFRQITGRPVAMILTAGLLMVFILMKLPALPMIGLSCGLVGLAWYGTREEARARAAQPASPTATATASSEKVLERMLESHPLQIELGVELLPFADSGKGGLLARISQVRQDTARRVGLVLPKVRVCDNLRIQANEFRILVDDSCVLQARIPADSVLNIGAVAVDQRSQGAAAAPVGLPWAVSAVWVHRELVGLAGPGETVEAMEVIARSLEWVVRVHAASLLTLDGLQLLLDETRKQHPLLVEETAGKRSAAASLHQVFRELASEGVPLRPMHQLLEAVMNARQNNFDMPRTVACCRQAVRRSLCERLRDATGRLPCFGLSDELERRIAEAVRNSETVGVWQLGISASLIKSVETGVRHMSSAGQTPVLLVRSDLRAALAGLLKSLRPTMYLLGEDEIDPSTNVDMIARIRLGDVTEPAGLAA